MALILMCGLSFSGKSTVAGRLARKLDAPLISLDAINGERGLRGGQGIPLEEWAATNRIAHERAATLLRAGGDVVVDDTGSPRFIRDEWRTTAQRVGARFAIVWVNIDTALQRERVLANRVEQQRPDVVDEVLADHAAHFEAPTDDENPIVIDARDTREDSRIRDLVDAIRSRARPETPAIGEPR
jgi:predicted kinase